MDAFKRGRAAIIIPEIQIRDAKVITGNAIEGEDSVRDISLAEAMHSVVSRSCPSQGYTLTSFGQGRDYRLLPPFEIERSEADFSQ